MSRVSPVTLRQLMGTGGSWQRGWGGGAGDAGEMPWDAVINKLHS